MLSINKPGLAAGLDRIVKEDEAVVAKAPDAEESPASDEAPETPTE